MNSQYLLMENTKSCPKCRHFYAGHCRLNPPPYVAVSESDWCGRFALVGVARGTPSKISDEMVLAIVEENWKIVPRPDGNGFLPSIATRRVNLVSQLMDYGVSQTPILKRIDKLVAQGRLRMGSDPHGKQDGICVWPPEKKAEETANPGRPVAMSRDELCGMIAELAPSQESAVSLRAVHRGIGERISIGALHAAVKELVAAGRVIQDEAGVYAAPTPSMDVG